jgi:lipopolysaccharide/colanic/teichoic acid biosynthesis glycosyltransferase
MYQVVENSRPQARVGARSRLGRGTKDLADRAAAAVALIVVSPLFCAIALWIRVTMGAPVFFVQERAGRDGVPFRMWKFRTMVNDAIGVGQRLGLTADPFGLVDNDPRITRAGRFLRRTSLDELPQLINVVLGQMSLVGPRPDVVEQVANYSEADRGRLVVKPGITGWAQVNGRDNLTWPQRFELDRWYVAHRSLWLDLRILWMTVATLHRDEAPVLVDELNIRRLRAVDSGVGSGADGG